MAHPPHRAEARAVRIAAAFSVHLFTASGAALALLALLSAARADWAAMFAWLGLALLIDAIDGAIARMLDVRTLIPRWSGDVLDLVVDILTYVFVPAYALAVSGLLPEGAAVGLSLAIVVTATLYFADARMKSADNYFVGFPAVWNLIAFYLFLLRPQPWIASGIVVALCALTFVPFPFLHPFRVVRLRAISLALLGAWLALAVAALASRLEPDGWITLALCAIGLYFAAAGLLRGRAPDGGV